MSLEFALVMAICLALAALWSRAGASGQGQRVARVCDANAHATLSLILLIAQLSSRGLPAEAPRGAAPGILPSPALSFQVIVVLLCLVWVLYLAHQRRLLLANSLRPPFLIIAMLMSAYLLSGLWSVSPTVTLFRTTELVSVALLMAHVVSAMPWTTALTRYLWAATGVAGVTAIASHEGSWVQAASFAGLRSNTGAAVAALVLFLGVWRIAHEGWRPRYVVWFTSAVLALIVFGSFATLVALCGALAVAGTVIARERVRVRTLVVFLLAAVIVAAGAWLLVEPLSADQYAAVLAEVGKRPEHLRNFTGRLPLWSLIIEGVAMQPWGYGYAGAEGLLASGGVFDVPNIGWQATHAHSGYMSALFGAGWPGLTLLLLMLITPLRGMARRHSGVSQACIAAMFTLIVINNVTIAGVGGHAGPIWGAFVAIFVISVSDLNTATRRPYLPSPPRAARTARTARVYRPRCG